MKNKDYIPATDLGLLAFSLNLISSLGSVRDAIGISLTIEQSLNDDQEAFSEAMMVISNPASKSATAVVAKNVARSRLVNTIRFIQRIANASPGITPVIRERLGFTQRKTVKSPIPAVETPPTISLLKAQPLVQFLQIRALGSENRSKPFGAISTELAYIVGTVPATDPEQLRVVGSFGKTPVLVRFQAGDVGKLVTYAARYRTRSGPGGVSQPSPWSQLVTFGVM